MKKYFSSITVSSVCPYTFSKGWLLVSLVFLLQKTVVAQQRTNNDSTQLNKGTGAFATGS